MSAQHMTAGRLATAAKRRARRARRTVSSLRRRRLPTATPYDGLVEEFTDRQVMGRLTVPDGKPVRVGLFANDMEVAAAWASDPVPGHADARAFQLRIRDIWAYVGVHDRLTLRVGKRVVPIAGHGSYLVPPKAGRRNLPELRTKFAAGYVFAQGGRLQLSKKLDTEWQATVMGLYQRVRALIAAEFGYDVFLVYGTLLGAVREGSVIGHDVDFDSAFVSRHSVGRDAAGDLRDIALYLIDQGFDVEVRATALHLHDTEDPSIRIDLFHFYFDEAGELAAPFGVAGTTVIRREQWAGTKEIDFCGGRALVPTIDEAFAEHLYGDSWRLPKPGFDWERDRTSRAREGVLSRVGRTTVLWENAYAHRPAQPDPSPFAVALLARDDLPQTVLDIGTGDGRDAAAFAAAGHRVVGFDASPRGLALATARGSAVDFVLADIASPNFGALLDEARGDGPVLFHLRFLIHAIDRPTEDRLLAALRDGARAGDVVAVEFRTDEDEDLPKTFGKHLRRFVPAAEFDARLTAAGFEIVDTADGTGLAPFGTEDPEIHRLLARRV